MFVEGNPAPTFKFYKVRKIIIIKGTVPWDSNGLRVEEKDADCPGFSFQLAFGRFLKLR